ncbi:hypothetical protein EV421DRAFT_1745867 [Armillaria borealis]|uniref:Uncharacterized protein n=1 Tax=Armillaria borealis TaxID=47425 RepID=A0AA39ICE1_9AGAR|nr:hypothetical protein EV421DRAFT_1745867 [Armillaria borealis]
MASLFRAYKSVVLDSALLVRRPMLAQCGIVLFGSNDIITQQLIEKKGLRRHTVIPAVYTKIGQSAFAIQAIRDNPTTFYSQSKSAEEMGGWKHTENGIISQDRRRPGNRLLTCQEVAHKVTPRAFRKTRKILPMIARFTSSRSSMDLVNAVTLFPIKMVAHVKGSWLAENLQNEAAFHATYLQGKTAPVHGGIWAANTTWGGGAVVCSIMKYHWRIGGPYNTPGNRPVLLVTRSLPQTPIDHPVKRWDAWELEEVGLCLELLGNKRFKDDSGARQLLRDYASHKNAEPNKEKRYFIQSLFKRRTILFVVPGSTGWNRHHITPTSGDR